MKGSSSEYVNTVLGDVSTCTSLAKEQYSRTWFGPVCHHGVFPVSTPVSRYGIMIHFLELTRVVADFEFGFGGTIFR
jgi:hypothetical protein